MKVISYAEERIVTTDQIADELLSYARELGRTKTADTVEVPSVYPDGHLGDVRMLIGPASQIAIADSDHEPVEIDSDEFVSELRRRSDEIRSGHSTAVGLAESEGFDLDTEIDDAIGSGESVA